MKKDILYKLSKEGLYPSYVELKASGISEEILEKIQFFDENPTKIFWETYISKTEDRIVDFDHDLTIKYCEIFILFQSSKIAFCFQKEFLKEILNAVYFMDNEDILLYCLDSKVIITGGHRGFTVWNNLNR